MRKKYNMATVMYPTNFEAFLKCIRDALKDGDKLLGYVVVEGPGCYNHGVFLEGPEKNIDSLMYALALTLQPGKYSDADIDDPALSEGQFECCERASKS